MAWPDGEHGIGCWSTGRVLEVRWERRRLVENHGTQGIRAVSLYGAGGTQIRGECHQAKIGEFAEGEESFCYQLLKREYALLQHGLILRLHVLHPRSTKQADESGFTMSPNGIPLT